MKKIFFGSGMPLAKEFDLNEEALEKLKEADCIDNDMRPKHPLPMKTIVKPVLTKSIIPGKSWRKA